MARVLDDSILEKKVRCPHCGRMIGYVNNDIDERHGRDYSGGPDGERFVRCPGEGCGKKIVLESW